MTKSGIGACRISSGSAVLASRRHSPPSTRKSVAGPLMRMAVVNVGKVPVAVDHGRVAMGMDMRLARRI